MPKTLLKKIPISEEGMKWAMKRETGKKIQDSDTIAAITGGMAGAYYGIPSGIIIQAAAFLDTDLLKIAAEFEKKYGLNIV